VSDCVFCLVARGEIPANVVYEDDDIIAFDDIAPQAPVHTLVIPKKHYSTLSDDIPEEMLGKLLSAVNRVAKIKGVDEGGYRVIINNGADAAQTVPHVHAHVIGGCSMAHGMVSF